jgi:hypothetical protein
VRDHLRAGCALFNDGHHHAAHDAWEDRWLALDRGTDDERFLHGLIQFTACVHHLHDGNVEGAVGLAESAGDYLAGLPDPYHAVALAPVRDYLGSVAGAGGSVGPAEAPALRHEGEVSRLADLAFPAAAVAAPILADAEGLDPDPVVAAAELARDGTDSPFAGLVHDFVRQAGNRRLIHDRLRRHVERQELADGAVDALFDG